jgi:hypothetical protein
MSGGNTQTQSITPATDLGFEDWQECRKTIGRFDTILEDLRKFGFSIITGLLGASGFLNFLGIPTSGAAPAADASAAVFITVMVLVAALFSVDTYYSVLLSGAVERALDLEDKTSSRIKVTKTLSRNATRSGISFIILALYIALLATAEGMGLFAAHGLKNLALCWPHTFWGCVLVYAIGICAVGILAGIVAGVCTHKQRTSGSKIKCLIHWAPLIMVALLIAGTILLAIFLLSSSVVDPYAVRYWIAAFGMFLAIYIQFYWLYCTWQSGLYRHRADRTLP